MEENYYDILEIERNATKTEIKSAYRKLAICQRIITTRNT